MLFDVTRSASLLNRKHLDPFKLLISDGKADERRQRYVQTLFFCGLSTSSLRFSLRQQPSQVNIPTERSTPSCIFHKSSEFVSLGLSSQAFVLLLQSRVCAVRGWSSNGPSLVVRNAPKTHPSFLCCAVIHFIYHGST